MQSKGRKYFFAAVNTGFASNGTPTEECIEFYRTRSGNGLYCTIVGNVVIPGGFGSNSHCSTISDQSEWRKLAIAISGMGAKPGIQLATTWDKYSGNRQFVPKSKIESLEQYKEIGNQITPEEIRSTFADLESGTELSIRAGFEHIQLHAAHGYFFNLAIDPRFCAFSDDALASLANWSKSLHRRRIETSIRLSATTGAYHFDRDFPNPVIDLLATMPIDFIDISDGFYNLDKRLIYPSTPQLLKRRADLTLEIARKHPNSNIIYTGKAVNQGTQIPNNVSIGICRDLIANPQFLSQNDIGCKNCMKCHYHSRRKSHVECGQWISDESYSPSA